MANYSKALAAVAAFLGVLLSQGILTGSAAQWASVILSALGAIGVYAIPNRPAAPAIQEVK